MTDQLLLLPMLDDAEHPTWRRMNVVEWDIFWEKIKNKCLAKAEEYK